MSNGDPEFPPSPFPAFPAFPEEETHADETRDDVVAEFPEEATHPGDGSEVAQLIDADQRESTLQSIVESLIFVADKPLSLQALGQLLGESDLGPVRAAVAALEAHYAGRGITLHSVAGGYQFRSSPQHASWVQKLLAQKPVRLSRALLETLAIVSYRQPITRPEIDDIRGVDSGGTLKTLMERALVRILGKKEEPGRPMLYGTTKEFLEFFNLADLKDLPSLREFHELSDEHRAQVEALAAAAPPGALESEGELEAARLDAAVQHNVLQRVDFKAPPEDTAELEEIDRLISTANPNVAGIDPAPPAAGPAAESPSEPPSESGK